MIRYISLSFLLLFFLKLSAQVPDSFDFKSLIYLQNMSNDGLSVLWVTNRACTSYVSYGESEQLDQKAFASHNGQIDANVPVQKIRLTNLEAGKTYFYKVISKEIKVYQAYRVVYGDSIVSPVHSFTIPSAKTKKFSFLAFNDVHDKPAYIDTVCKSNPDFSFVCYNGDILGDIYNEEQILNGICRPSAKAFGGDKPFYYTRGNHETRGPESRMLSQFVDSPNGLFYNSFLWGNTCIMVIDTGEDKEDSSQYYFGLAAYDKYRSEQAEWIKSVTSSKEWKRATHRIVCGHIPASLEPGDGHGTEDVANKITPLLNKSGVDLYICGHTHSAKIERPNQFHKYTMVVGGGPVSEDQGKGTTFIKVNIDGSKTNVELHKKDGELIDLYSVN